MGARNLRRNLSLLHYELEELIWALHCLTAVEDSGSPRNRLVRFGKYGVYIDGVTNILNTLTEI